MEEFLLLELQDAPTVRENGSARGGLWASAVVYEVLREGLARALLAWVQEMAALLGQARPMAPAPALAAAGERPTAPAREKELRADGHSGRRTWLKPCLWRRPWTHG